MNPIQIQALVSLVITIAKSVIQVWNSLDPKTRAKIAGIPGAAWDKIIDAIKQMQQGKEVNLDDLYLTKTAEDILKELQAEDNGTNGNNGE